MGFFDSIGSIFNPSNFMGSKGNSLLDLMDPGNTFHTGAASRRADEQFALEMDIANKNFEEAKAQNAWNRGFQEQVLNYQRDLNALQMEREDTSVARRVADLKASGLSPTLAAGTGAAAAPMHAGSISPVAPAQKSTPSDVRVQAAMFKEQMAKDKLALATTMLGNFANVSKTMAETKLLDAQTNQMNAWTPVDLKLKEQLYEFNQEYNPYRLQDMIARIENTRGDTFYKERQSFLADSQILLNQDQHGLNALIYAGKILDNELTRAKINYQNQEYVKNAIAIELLRSQYKEYEYAREFFHDRFSGAPVGYSLPTLYQSLPNQINNIAGGIGSALEKGWNKTTDFVSRTVKKADNFLQSVGLIDLLHRITGNAFNFSE